MPVQGSMVARVGDFPLIPDKYQAAVAAGINFFELRYPRRIEFPERLFGPFDVRVREEDVPNTMRSSYHANWLTQHNAHISYEVVNKRGLGMAFMPDDPFWHNRITLVDNPSLREQLAQYHTRTGAISHAEISVELDVLEEQLNEDGAIWNLVDSAGRVRDWAPTEALASAKREEYIPHRDSQGNVIREIQPNIRLRIVKATARVRRPAIESLIVKYKGLEFGWSQCQEFREIIERVRKDSAVRRRTVVSQQSTMSPADGRQMLLDALESMDPDTFANLMRKAGLVAAPSPAAPVERAAIEDSEGFGATGNVPRVLPGLDDPDPLSDMPNSDVEEVPVAAPAVQKAVPREESLRKSLDAMHIAVIRGQVRKDNPGLDVMHMTKAELIDVLVKALSVPAEASQPANLGTVS